MKLPVKTTKLEWNPLIVMRICFFAACMTICAALFHP
jgi:hypothetical protein